MDYFLPPFQSGPEPSQFSLLLPNPPLPKPDISERHSLPALRQLLSPLFNFNQPFQPNRGDYPAHLADLQNWTLRAVAFSACPYFLSLLRHMHTSLLGRPARNPIAPTSSGCPACRSSSSTASSRPSLLTIITPISLLQDFLSSFENLIYELFPCSFHIPSRRQPPCPQRTGSSSRSQYVF